MQITLLNRLPIISKEIPAGWAANNPANLQLLRNRAVSSYCSRFAIITSHMALSSYFAARKLEEFAAFRKRPLHLGRRLTPQNRSLERRFLCSSVLSLGDTGSRRPLKWVFKNRQPTSSLRSTRSTDERYDSA